MSGIDVGTRGRVPDIILEDQKSAGTAGGTFTNGADRVRTLNTEVRDAYGECSLSSNQFTLPAGTWYITWRAPAYRVSSHQSFLYNVTDTAEVKRGTSENAVTTGQSNASIGSAVVTITASKAFEIRHRCTSTQATNGFGEPPNFGTEVYTRVEIWKLA